MGDIPATFSKISKRLTGLNDRLAIDPSLGVARGGAKHEAGPFGFSDMRTPARRQLDKALGVPPSEGDPGYVAPPEPPIIPPPTPMPDPDPSSLASLSARRRSIQAQLARRGRMSTVLSQTQLEPLGG